MNCKIIVCLVLVGAAFASTACAKGLFDNPVALFPDANLIILSKFEQAKIETTHRGFYLRADTAPGIRNEYDPSEAGLYLDVAVRDPQEISKFNDSHKSSGKLTERTIAFPPTKGDPDALRITFIYGASADTGAVSTLNQDIDDVIKKYNQSMAAP